MSRPLCAFFLPELVAEDQLAGGLVVVIDVLRATTTIVHALAAGAREVVPCQMLPDARRKAAEAAPGESVLGGERGGLKIDGFDLGNSPEEYTPEIVKGKTLFFSTTNGTKAMLRCRLAGRVLIGSFSNLVALCRTVREATEPIHLLCAGTNGQITREDTLLAGTIVHLLLQADSGVYELNDQAQIAADVARQTVGVALSLNDRNLATASIVQVLRNSLGGRNLIQVGLEADLVRASQLDLFDLVPQLDVAAWSIKKS